MTFEFYIKTVYTYLREKLWYELQAQWLLGITCKNVVKRRGKKSAAMMSDGQAYDQELFSLFS